MRAGGVRLFIAAVGADRVRVCVRRGFTVLANDYYAEGDSVQALEIYERAAKMQEANAQTKSGNKNPGGGGSLNQIYNNMAVVHMDKVDYTTALDFYAKAAENKPDTPPDAETLGNNPRGSFVPLLR